MQFKDKFFRKQWNDELHPFCQMVGRFFCQQSYRMGIDPVVTRITDKLRSGNESGVHPAGRGIDFRDEHAGERLYTDEQVKFLLDSINNAWPRSDGKKTIIHHKGSDNQHHFHIQAPSNFAVLKQPKDSQAENKEPGKAIKKTTQKRSVKNGNNN